MLLKKNIFAHLNVYIMDGTNYILPFQGSRQLRPLLCGNLQRQGDHGLECQLHGTKEPQDHAGQVGHGLFDLLRNGNHSQHWNLDRHSASEMNSYSLPEMKNTNNTNVFFYLLSSASNYFHF